MNHGEDRREQTRHKTTNMVDGLSRKLLKNPGNIHHSSKIKTSMVKSQRIGTINKQLLPLPSNKKQSIAAMNSAYISEPQDSDFVSQSSYTLAKTTMFTEAP